MKRKIIAAALGLVLLTGIALICFFAVQNKNTAQPEIAPQTLLTDGFQLCGDRFLLVQNGAYLSDPGAGTCQGVPYTCDENGILTVTGIVPLNDGSLCIAEDGRLCSARGLYEFDGGLYFIAPDGTLLCDAEQDTLYFGADGRYTCQNADIDAYVDEIVAAETDSAMTQLQKLRAVYEYIYRHMTYQSNNNHVPRGADASTWTQTYMLRLMERGRGNCYCFASEMYYLARRLGFSARAISGGIGKNDADHGWVEIVLDGTAYVFDPEQDAKHYPTPGHYYMVTYDKTPRRYWLPS